MRVLARPWAQIRVSLLWGGGMDQSRSCIYRLAALNLFTRGHQMSQIHGQPRAAPCMYTCHVSPVTSAARNGHCIHRGRSFTEWDQATQRQSFRSGVRSRCSSHEPRQKRSACRAQSADAPLAGDDTPVVAGIPVSVDDSTAIGERLWEALQRDPQEFVPLVAVELQQVRPSPPSLPDVSHFDAYHWE